MSSWLSRLLALFIAAYALLMTYIIGFGFYDVTSPSDLIVVLGNEVYKDGSLSPRLQARMDRAIQLYHDKRGHYLFVSGGTGLNGVGEAAAMKAYAQANNVPASRIIADPLGVNTEATAKNAALFMQREKLSSAIMVSQYFHLARCDFAFKSHGVANRGRSFARYFEWRDVYSIFRETVALSVYFVKHYQKNTGT